MKPVAVGLAIVVVVTPLALVAVIRPTWRAPERCSGRVVIVHPPRGEPMECACDTGVFSACFSPGP